MENIPQINAYERMVYRNQFSSNPRPRKIRKKSLRRRSGSRFFYTLTRLAHDTHQTLIEKGSPLRLCLYGDENDMAMDVIIMNKIKKVRQSFTRPIKIENLKPLVKSIHNQVGLVFDYSV
jgi:hypothetical protein